MELSYIIKNYRTTHRLTMEEFSKRVGVSKAYISMLEKNKNSTSGKPIKPSLDTLKRIAEAMNLTFDSLLNMLDENSIFTLDTECPLSSDSHLHSKTVRIPVLGYVVAGVPISAVQDILGYEEISKDLSLTGEFFALRIKGDSMEPTFTEGDIIIVRQQPDVESNEIAVVLVNGDEGTVKRIKKDDHGIVLIGDNALAFSPKFYSNDEIASLPIKIVGKVVELRRSF